MYNLNLNLDILFNNIILSSNKMVINVLAHRDRRTNRLLNK
jgi:hypothetical protein